MNDNQVSPYGVKPRALETRYSLKVDLMSFCCQAGNLTASYDNNCTNIQWSFLDTSDISEVFSKTRALLTVDRQSFVSVTYGLLLSIKSCVNPARGLCKLLKIGECFYTTVRDNWLGQLIGRGPWDARAWVQILSQNHDGVLLQVWTPHFNSR